MKKSKTFKASTLLLTLLMALSGTACNHTKEKHTSPSPQVTQEASVIPENSATPDTKDNTVTPSPKVNQSINKIEAGLGDLKLYYNNKWTYNEEQSSDNSLAFTRGNTLLGVICSNENTFQLSKEMMTRSLNMVKQQQEDFKLLEDMKEIKVNGETWYECTYQTGKGEDAQCSLQRTYGKGYAAYTVTYTGLKDDFKAYMSNAQTILDSCIMDVPDAKLGEEEAKKELVGELDAGQYGYLELKEDGTYYWYNDSSKAMDNVHYGTYICDNKIKALNIKEGQNGYYLALFPSKYFVNGVEKDMGTYKIDIAISLSKDEKADYQGVNLGNYTVYDFVRTK